MAVQDVVKIAKVSEYLAADDRQRIALTGQAPQNTPLLLNLEWKALNDRVGKVPSDATLDATAAYVLSLCGAYAARAQAVLLKAGTGGGVVVPQGQTAPSSSGTLTPIRITGAAFKNATQYDNATLLGKTLLIFWNDIPRFLQNAEWGFTATGIEILVSGFDSAKGCDFIIYIY